MSKGKKKRVLSRRGQVALLAASGLAGLSIGFGDVSSEQQPGLRTVFNAAADAKVRESRDQFRQRLFPGFNAPYQAAPDEVLPRESLAAALNRLSGNPLARPLIEAAAEEDLWACVRDDFFALAGVFHPSPWMITVGEDLDDSSKIMTTLHEIVHARTQVTSPPMDVRAELIAERVGEAPANVFPMMVAFSEKQAGRGDLWALQTQNRPELSQVFENAYGEALLAGEDEKEALISAGRAAFKHYVETPVDFYIRLVFERQLTRLNWEGGYMDENIARYVPPQNYIEAKGQVTPDINLAAGQVFDWSDQSVFGTGAYGQKLKELVESLDARLSGDWADPGNPYADLDFERFEQMYRRSPEKNLLALAGTIRSGDEEAVETLLQQPEKQTLSEEMNPKSNIDWHRRCLAVRIAEWRP